MPAKPWLKFYPTDWQADQSLGCCGLAARGLLAEMMCIMHKSDPYGFLLVNGHEPSITELSRLCRASEGDVLAALGELDRASVISRNRAGIIYSRRMVRDDKKRYEGEKAQKSQQKTQKTTPMKNVEKQVKFDLPPGYPTGSLASTPLTQMPEARIDLSVDDDSYTTGKDRNASNIRSNRKANGEAVPREAAQMEFESWWKSYPNRVGKRGGEIAYTKARKKVSAEILMTAAIRYAELTKDCERKFIKHPTSWLNGECWNDEIPSTPIDENYRGVLI